MTKSLLRDRSLGIIVLILVVMAILELFLPDYWTRILIKILIMVLFATSLNIQLGYGGMLALGHAMYLGIGAYSFGLMSLKVGMPMLPAFVMTLLISAVISAALGFISLRSSIMAFALLNLAFNLLLSTLILKWTSLTGGDSGIVGIQRPIFFTETQSYFYFVLIVVAVCLFIIWIIINSPFGKIVQGLRENENRLLFLGINIRRFQLVVYIISAIFAAVAGVLLSMADKGVFPGYAGVTQSIEVIMMCVIGGMTSFAGPSLGALIVVLIQTVASMYFWQWQGLLGIIIIVCVLGFRGGILGKRSRVQKKTGKKLSSEVTT
jgi:branched-chain amino acid transport system permease protein